MYCHQYFLGDLIQLQTIYTSKWWDIHEKFIETITTSIFYLKFKENNENDMEFVLIFSPVNNQAKLGRTAAKHLLTLAFLYPL